jgi:hypothetical protein
VEWTATDDDQLFLAARCCELGDGKLTDSAMTDGPEECASDTMHILCCLLSYVPKFGPLPPLTGTPHHYSSRLRANV